MNYAKLEAEILAEIEWRVKELTVLKTLPIKRTLNLKERHIAVKFAIPNIYSTWEGFVKTAFRIYINELNSLSLQHFEINSKILSHNFDTKYPQLTTGVKNEFKNKCKFIDDFIADLTRPISLDTKLPTESNVNWKVLNKILDRFNLDLFPENPYKSKLNDLLFIRNSVAHGDNSIPINQQLIDDNVSFVINLMDETMYRILDGCTTTKYRK